MSLASVTCSERSVAGRSSKPSQRWCSALSERPARSGEGPRAKSAPVMALGVSARQSAAAFDLAA